MQMELDDGTVAGAIAALAGIGVAVGGIYFVEQRAKTSSSGMTEQLYTKLASKMDGADAENKFSGTDQTLESLIAGMEEAQKPIPHQRILAHRGSRESRKRKPRFRRRRMTDGEGWQRTAGCKLRADQRPLLARYRVDVLESNPEPSGSCKLLY
eukprot:759067-Hanusia_phi.AAC.2